MQGMTFRDIDVFVFEFLQKTFALTIDKLTILAKMPILVEKYCDEVAPSQSGH